MKPRTLFDKIWEARVVEAETRDHPAILSIDRHLIHEVTSPQAFEGLRERGLSVRRPDRTTATMDHSTPTLPRGADGSLPILDSAALQLDALKHNCHDFGIELFEMGDSRRGIVHVIGPELGLTLPGMTIVCGDSHTSTHGAFGAYAFGIGTSEVQHVLATQCLLQRKPRTMSVRVDGVLDRGVTAKDLILAIIAQIGVSGATGHVIEYRGEVIESLDMEERMTVCNMSIEAGARAGMIAPDETTFAFLRGLERAPIGVEWDRAVSKWRQLRTDPGAAFDREVVIDAASVKPMITWGTTPAMAGPIGSFIPDCEGNAAAQQALDYMAFSPGMSLDGFPVDTVFIGSCTNGRLRDLRGAASLLRDRHVAPEMTCLVVPGSGRIKRQAEIEGLARIFIDAGCEWREPGCSMCLGMNGDTAGRGQYVVSTSNRNFEGRQGVGARTLLASPLTAAATAVCGRVTDPRELLYEPHFMARD